MRLGNAVDPYGHRQHVPRTEYPPSLETLVARVHSALPAEHRLVGIDLITPNISKNVLLLGRVNEVNAHPDLSGHLAAWGRAACPFEPFHQVLDALLAPRRQHG